MDVAEEKGEEDLRWEFQRPTLGPIRNFNVVSGELYKYYTRAVTTGYVLAR